MEYKEYNEKDLQSFEYETTIQSDGKIIGVCELGKATIQMINDSNNYSTFKESWIKTPHGSFYIYDVSPVQEKVNIKLECYDIKYKLDTLYNKEKHIFPLTLKKWRNSIFDDCGVEYDDSDFPNSDLILNEQPSIEEGSTNRDIIKMISEAGCSTIITDNNDKFYFDWFDDTTEPYKIIDWLELTTENENSKAINTVVLGRGNTEDNVYYPESKSEFPVEFRIDNNYILDPQEVDSDEDKRYDVILDIYDRVDGFSYLTFNIRTQSVDKKLSIKLGQRIKYQDIWENELIAYVMTKKITWLGGDLSKDDNYEIILSAEEIKETSTNLDYSSNIKNSLLEVTRKTDKNSGQIEDLVKKTDEYGEDFTKIYQDVLNIINSVQNTGGSNLIKNSVMFAYNNDNEPDDWNLEGDGVLSIQSSPEANSAGSLSGHTFTLNNKLVKQKIEVKANINENDLTYYTFSTKIKKNAVGSCYVKIYNSMEEYIIRLDEGEESYYGDYEIKKLLPKENYYIIEFYGSDDSNATFTDNMFAVGEYKSQWQQASGEIMNTQVNININGVLVKSSVYQGDYTVMSPLEFAGYSKINGVITKVFSLNKDITLVKKLEAEDEIKMPPIKIVPITSGKLQGWAFVPSIGGKN